MEEEEGGGGALEETLGSWRINRQTVWSTTGGSRCCPAEGRGKLVCVRSSWGSRLDDFLASYLVGGHTQNTLFKFSVNIGIFS